MLAALTSRLLPDLPPRGSDEEQARPSDRRRDWLSFLTWSFFLAELAGREGLFAPGAHAAENDSARPTGHPGEDGAAADNLPVNAIATDAEEPLNAVSSQGPLIVNPQPTHLAGAVADAETATPEDIEAQRLSAGFGGGGGADGDHLMSTSAPDTGAPHISLALGQPLDVGDIDLKLASGALDGLDNLLPGVQLDVPLIADLLNTATYGIGSLATGTVSSLSPILSIGGLGDSHGGGNDDATGSMGHLNFADPPSPSEPDAAPTQGGYTDYGIALNLSFSNSEPATASSLHQSDDASGSSSFDHGDWHAPSISATSDALHADEAVFRLASDTLA
jgi:hypothetical protein